MAHHIVSEQPIVWRKKMEQDQNHYWLIKIGAN